MNLDVCRRRYTFGKQPDKRPMIAIADTPDAPASRNRPTFSPDVKEEAEEAMQ